jgi:hypothetical protein
MGREGFGEFAQGIGTTVEQFVLLGTTGPDALRKVTAQTLASLSREATVKSLMALADGFVHLFTNPAQSAADFTAAAIYGSIAVASGIAGRKVAGDVFSKEQNGGASSGAGGGSGNGTSNGNAPEYKFNYGGQPGFASSEVAGSGARATADAINRLATAQQMTAAELSRIRSLPAEQVVTMGAMGARAALGEASVAHGHENDGHNAIRYRQIVGGG